MKPALGDDSNAQSFLAFLTFGASLKLKIYELPLLLFELLIRRKRRVKR